MTAARYSFLGHPCPDELAARFADRLTLFDTRYRTHVVRQRTQRLVPVDDRARQTLRGAVA